MKAAGALLAVLLAARPATAAAQSRGAETPEGLVRRADSLFQAGDWPRARALYQRIVDSQPDQSHAIYRLAELSDDPRAALRWFEAYVALEPDDPWGYLAVGGTLVRLGRYSEALAWYARARQRSPGERDVVLGEARALAAWGHTDAAVSRYRQWVAAHPEDAEAWDELGRQELKAGRPGKAASAWERTLALVPGRGAVERRLRLARALAAPAVEPVAGGSRDSDGNAMWRVGARAELAAGAGARVGVAAERASLADGLDVGASEGIEVQARWRPRAVLRVEAGAGLQRTSSSARPLSEATVATGDLRVRFQAPGGGTRLELKARHEPLALSPVLIANRVTRSELGASVALPAGPVSVRGMGRLGLLQAGGATNRRRVWGTGLALPLVSGVELSGQFQQLSYRDSSGVGYFAPRLAQLVEAATYAELEPTPSWALALDLGAGVQRAAEHGAPVGRWRSAFRLWMLSRVALQPGRELVLELESYDAPLATAQPATSAAWRWGSAAVSLRWSL